MDEIRLLKHSISKSSSSWSKYATVGKFPKFTELWKNSYRDLCGDLKGTKWLRGLGWLVGIIWIFGLIAGVCTISVLSFSSSTTACQPDGSFRLHPETFSMWSSSGYFQITLGGGHLTFTEAKVIDISWDIVIGRGGQFLLAILSWKVFAKYLTICMETQPITYQTFRTIFLQNEGSILSTCSIIKSFVWQRRLKSKTAMAFMILTMVFILAFPTLASAMSGYDSNVGSYLPDYDNNFVPFNNFSRVLYVIHDGWRINQTNEFWVVSNSTSGYYASDPVLSDRYDRCRQRRKDQVIGNDNCALENQVSNYVWEYGLGGTKNVSSTFNLTDGSLGPEIPPPILNISAYDTSGDTTLGGSNQPSLLRPLSWFRANKTYSIAYVEENGSCQNTGDYQWGFSFLQLLVSLILLIMWTIGIYILWLRAHFTQKLRGRESCQTSGEHKAVLELAVAMQQELDIQQVNVSLLIERQLDDRVDKELKGGAMSYAPAYPELKTYSFRKGTKNWFKREKWWFALIVVSSLLSSTLWMVYNTGLWRFWFWLFGLWLALILAMCIGTSNGSRALIILFCCILDSLVMIGLLILTR